MRPPAKPEQWARMGIPAAARHELVRLARDKKSRTAVFKVDAPSEWRPTSVLHPQSGLPFTDVGAWNFVADLLESGCEASAIAMEKPPGTTGYVILTSGYPGYPKIYIKLTLTASIIHGRSFHNSEF